MTASHLKKTDEIEIKGRVRYEATGRKTVFGLKENFKLSALAKAKEKIKEMYDVMRNKMWLIETKPAVEISFEINENRDSSVIRFSKTIKFRLEN